MLTIQGELKMRIKVGVMPGRLEEMNVQEGITAQEIFNRANIEVSNHEIRLDGEKITLDTIVNSGSLLVAMKMIKGNAKTIKIGTMPGRLEEITYEEGKTAMELFELAGIEVQNHEIRLDGEKIALDTIINNGGLLVAMKMIKGNSGIYITDLTKEEVEMLLDVALPTVIEKEWINYIDSDHIIINISQIENGSFIVKKDMFESVYTLKSVDIVDEAKTLEESFKTDIKEVQVLRAENNIIRMLQEELDYILDEHQRKVRELEQVVFKKNYLQELLDKVTVFN